MILGRILQTPLVQSDRKRWVFIHPFQQNPANHKWQSSLTTRNFQKKLEPLYPRYSGEGFE